MNIVYESKYNYYSSINNKYKMNKYLHKILSGGNKHSQDDIFMKYKTIVNYINNLSHKDNINDIKLQLFDLLKSDDYCQKIIGEGGFGKVFVPEQNYATLLINNKSIKIPIVIKESHVNNESLFNINIIHNILYIHSFEDITTEALILMYIHQLYDKTVHLPLMLNYATCNSDKINRIIMKKYGLNKEQEIDLKNTYSGPPWFKNRPPDIRKTNIVNIHQLFEYIQYNKYTNDNGDDMIILPNQIKCNVIKLIDYICISYLATHYLLAQNNIFISDMKPENIFIHWLDKKSYYGATNIKNIKSITYKINDSYYEIETFGFVIILGDLGTSIIKIKDDVIMVGNIYDLNSNYEEINRQMIPNINCFYMLSCFRDLLTFEQLEKTIIHQIYKSDPYNKIFYINYGWQLPNNIINNYLNPLELLIFFNEYKINKHIKKSNNIVINCN